MQRIFEAEIKFWFFSTVRRNNKHLEVLLYSPLTVQLYQFVNFYFLDQELVWEGNRSQLSRLRSENACVRADIYLGDKILGYKVTRNFQ